MLKNEELERFYALRAKLFEGIKRSLAEDGHCKSYEGAMQICFPNYFEQTEDPDYSTGDAWAISLDCYVVGPSRHYSWAGMTFLQALEGAEKDILKWLGEPTVQASDKGDE